MMEVFSVGGRFPTTAMRNTLTRIVLKLKVEGRGGFTVMLSIADIPSVIFSPDSLGIMKTKREITLIRKAGRM